MIADYWNCLIVVSCGSLHKVGVQTDLQRSNFNLQLGQVLGDGFQNFGTQHRVPALCLQVTDDLLLARFTMHHIVQFLLSIQFSRIQILRTPDHVTVSICSTILQAEEAKGSSATFHATSQGAAALKVHKSLQPIKSFTRPNPVAPVPYAPFCIWGT